MDIATLIGLVVAFGLVLSAIMMGGSITLFIDPVSILIVIGGTIGVILINYTLKDVLGVFGVASKAFMNKPLVHRDILIKLVEFAQVVRKEGILALESMIGDIDDQFFAKGLQMAIDGQEPKIIEETLQREVDKVMDRHGKGAEILTALGTFAPAMGMIGTLIGLVLMLQNMDDPSTIGPSMAVALLTTFYGAAMANMVFLPLAGKLKAYSKEEVLAREIIIAGLQSLVAGENPRTMEQKLMGYLPPKERQSAFE